MIFLLNLYYLIKGLTSDEKQQNLIMKENIQYADIVQGNFVDKYRNISYKATMGNLWVSEFCEQAEFVVKADDDTCVDIFEVIQ